MIVWLASYPRSGNTLYRMLLYHLEGIETYSIYNDRDITKMGASEAVGHRKLAHSLDYYRRAPDAYYIKTHSLPKDDLLAVYIVRDVRDVMVSYAHYRQDIDGCGDDLDTILRRLIVGNRWGGWSTHVLRWITRDQTVMTVKFEDLVEQPETVFLNTEREAPEFEELHYNWPKFFRKGKVGGWKDEMSDEIEALCWKHHGKVMGRLGYER